MLTAKNRIINDSYDSYSGSKYLRTPFAENKHVNHVPIKHKKMSFMSNGGKFKLYTVPNGLLFSMPTQPRFSFERMIYLPFRTLLQT
jgi:hypothetical protein